ncbi:MAG: phosphoribosyl-ATP diphosphatase [Coriobacteriales bacterium]|jgi:phosphoribosyl-ATP pyrophosphohydrolase
MGYKTENVKPGDIGETLTKLAATIHQRWEASEEVSYTSRLLNGPEEKLQKKVGEEAIETILAADKGDEEHIRYEAADLVYHLMVLLEKHGISISDLAGELNARMK